MLIHNSLILRQLMGYVDAVVTRLDVVFEIR